MAKRVAELEKMAFEVVLGLNTHMPVQDKRWRNRPSPMLRHWDYTLEACIKAHEHLQCLASLVYRKARIPEPQSRYESMDHWR
jgi:hypothetical protein